MQMEFYLSDTNLVKDVFLQRHMDELGFVPLEVYVAATVCLPACNACLEHLASKVQPTTDNLAKKEKVKREKTERDRENDDVCIGGN